MQNDNTYNGWSNYATWRVNLEMFDGNYEIFVDYGLTETHEYAEAAKQYAEEIIECEATEGLARDYALAFLSNVNWYEIAKHIEETVKEEENA